MGVLMDVTERKCAQEEIQIKMDQIELQHRLLEQREQERLKIARDIHDGPVQELTGAHYALEGIQYTSEDEVLKQGLLAIRETIKNQVAELRAYAAELRPPALPKFGLGKAIRSHMETFQDKHPELMIQFEEQQVGDLLPEEVRLALFRIYQEALTNIAKHAHAKDVVIRLEKKKAEVRLEIQDDGSGFTISKDWLELARTGHLGLVGMRERAEAVEGTLEIVSQPGAGTTIRVEVPLG
jgi:signal transduction histidine kinase